MTTAAEALEQVRALAEVQAISCRAQHRADHERNWLDVLAIIERASVDAPAHEPCCSACGGTGTNYEGICWDCRGTGCAHP